MDSNNADIIKKNEWDINSVRTSVIRCRARCVSFFIGLTMKYTKRCCTVLISGRLALVNILLNVRDKGI